MSLVCPGADVTLADLARLTDAFYIGGTKLGALLGEAVVILNRDLDRDFRYIMKQRGGILAKGRLLGVQFAELMRDGLYERTAKREVDLAWKLRRAFEEKGWPLASDSPTNQQFPIVPDADLAKLAEKYSFSEWGRYDEGRRIVPLLHQLGDEGERRGRPHRRHPRPLSGQAAKNKSNAPPGQPAGRFFAPSAGAGSTQV